MEITNIHIKQNSCKWSLCKFSRYRSKDMIFIHLEKNIFIQTKTYQSLAFRLEFLSKVILHVNISIRTISIKVKAEIPVFFGQ